MHGENKVHLCIPIIVYRQQALALRMGKFKQYDSVSGKAPIMYIRDTTMYYRNYFVVVTDLRECRCRLRCHRHRRRRDSQSQLLRSLVNNFGTAVVAGQNADRKWHGTGVVVRLAVEFFAKLPSTRTCVALLLCTVPGFHARQYRNDPNLLSRAIVLSKPTYHRTHPYQQRPLKACCRCRNLPRRSRQNQENQSSSSHRQRRCRRRHCLSSTRSSRSPPCRP